MTPHCQSFSQISRSSEGLSIGHSAHAHIPEHAPLKDTSSFTLSSLPLPLPLPLPSFAMLLSRSALHLSMSVVLPQDRVEINALLLWCSVLGITALKLTAICTVKFTAIQTKCEHDYKPSPISVCFRTDLHMHLCVRQHPHSLLSSFSLQLSL